MVHPAETFFKLLLGPSTRGYICIATLEPGNDLSFKERFFSWPDNLNDMVGHVDKYTPTHNVYLCPQLLKSPKRIKENVITVTAAWADLDECDPDNLQVKPSILIESSPMRYQAYWVFEDPVPPFDAEELSKRIAYFHSFQGADRSGWDLTQLLRVPGTFNRKAHVGEALVSILEANRNKYRVEDFAKYPKVLVDVATEEFPFPAEELEDKSGEEVLVKYEDILPPLTRFLFENTPDKDAKEGWSGALWSLYMTCYEGNLSREETFLIARDSACNKFKRDSKPMSYLWIEICRAWTRHRENKKLLEPETTRVLPLLTQEEHSRISGVKTFVEEYTEWAKSLGDAAPQYHQAGALIILSTLLSGTVRLPTSFGTIKPNLWFMILADTTLTRKTTAMDIAMDLLEKVDSDTIMATDGSIEGLMTSLSMRPGKPSIFLRDEFSGLLEAMTKKDYMAGMAETLTKLYDGKLQKRVLKKEIIEVKDPCLVIFAGGIKNKTTALLTTEHVSSGFIPRFIFITAESDVTKVKPLGPPTKKDHTVRDKIIKTMQELRAHYTSETRLALNDKGEMVFQESQPFEASLTEEAWARYNLLEADMMKAGLATTQPEIMTPTYDRLCKSALKTAVLIAAARIPKNKEVIVGINDILVAIKYAEGWRTYVNEIVNNIGLGHNEREFANILKAVSREPGITRSKLMQRYHLTARSADHIFSTLEQRGQIMLSRKGQAQIVFPFGQAKKKIVVSGKELK